MAATELNSRLVTLKQAQKYVKYAFKLKKPVMVWGPPGIGKSECVEQITNSFATNGKTSLLIDVRLSLWEPTDIKGIPYYNPEAKGMVWAHPTELPSAELASRYDTIVLFLDELNGAAPSVQAAAYQLILNRRVGEYHLPANVVIVAAGNRESDKGVTYRMPKPLANRFIHFEVKVDFETWVEWATHNTIHPDVVGYLTSRKADLFKFDPSSTERAFPTPRSWATVSSLLYGCEDFSESEVTDMVSGTIGEGTAIQLQAHRQVSSKLPNPELILAGKIDKLETTELSAKYSLCTSLSYELKLAYDNQTDKVAKGELSFNDKMDNMLSFMMNNFDPELVIMAVRVLFTQYQIKPRLRELKTWPDFYERYGDIIKAT